MKYYEREQRGWIIVLAILLMFALTGCSNKNDTYVKWRPTDAETARVICQNNNVTACVQMSGKGCTIISPHMPMQEFTGTSATMVSPQWRALAHELMHCLGYEHVEQHDREPTPK